MPWMRSQSFGRRSSGIDEHEYPHSPMHINTDLGLESDTDGSSNLSSPSQRAEMSLQHTRRQRRRRDAARIRRQLNRPSPISSVATPTYDSEGTSMNSAFNRLTPRLYVVTGSTPSSGRPARVDANPYSRFSDRDGPPDTLDDHEVPTEVGCVLNDSSEPLSPQSEIDSPTSRSFEETPISYRRGTRTQWGFLCSNSAGKDSESPISPRWGLQQTMSPSFAKRALSLVQRPLKSPESNSESPRERRRRLKQSFTERKALISQKLSSSNKSSYDEDHHLLPQATKRSVALSQRWSRDGVSQVSENSIESERRVLLKPRVMDPDQRLACSTPPTRASPRVGMTPRPLSPRRRQFPFIAMPTPETSIDDSASSHHSLQTPIRHRQTDIPSSPFPKHVTQKLFFNKEADVSANLKNENSGATRALQIPTSCQQSDIPSSPLPKDAERSLLFDKEIGASTNINTEESVAKIALQVLTPRQQVGISPPALPKHAEQRLIFSKDSDGPTKMNNDDSVAKRASKVPTPRRQGDIPQSPLPQYPVRSFFSNKESEVSTTRKDETSVAQRVLKVLTPRGQADVPPSPLSKHAGRKFFSNKDSEESTTINDENSVAMRSLQAPTPRRQTDIPSSPLRNHAERHFFTNQDCNATSTENEENSVAMRAATTSGDEVIGLSRSHWGKNSFLKGDCTQAESNRSAFDRISKPSASRDCADISLRPQSTQLSIQSSMSESVRFEGSISDSDYSNAELHDCSSSFTNETRTALINNRRKKVEGSISGSDYSNAELHNCSSSFTNEGSATEINNQRKNNCMENASKKSNRCVASPLDSPSDESRPPTPDENWMLNQSALGQSKLEMLENSRPGDMTRVSKLKSKPVLTRVPSDEELESEGNAEPLRSPLNQINHKSKPSLFPHPLRYRAAADVEVEREVIVTPKQQEKICIESEIDEDDEVDVMFREFERELELAQDAALESFRQMDSNNSLTTENSLLLKSEFEKSELSALRDALFEGEFSRDDLQRSVEQGHDALDAVQRSDFIEQFRTSPHNEGTEKVPCCRDEDLMVYDDPSLFEIESSTSEVSVVNDTVSGKDKADEMEKNVSSVDVLQVDSLGTDDDLTLIALDSIRMFEKELESAQDEALHVFRNMDQETNTNLQLHEAKHELETAQDELEELRAELQRADLEITQCRLLVEQRDHEIAMLAMERDLLKADLKQAQAKQNQMNSFFDNFSTTTSSWTESFQDTFFACPRDSIQRTNTKVSRGRFF